MNHRIREVAEKMRDLFLSRSHVRAQDNERGPERKRERSDTMIPTDGEPFPQIHTRLNRLIQNMFQIVQRLAGRLHPPDGSIQDPRQEEILILLNRLQVVSRENVSALSSLSKEFMRIISLQGSSDFLNRFPEAAEECSIRCQKLVQTVEGLTSIFPEVEECIGSLSASTTSVMSNTNLSVQGIRRLAEETHETMQMVEEMRHCLAEGRVTVNQNVKVADHVRQTVMVSAEMIKKLGARTREIGDMVKVIRNVAERTNLLALNAGIIAAQAGEDGKAFAVVADEIKALADQTTISAKNISQMVSKFQKESVQSVESIEQGVAKVEEGVNSTWRVGEALDQINRKVSGVGDRVSSFSSALLEQIEIHHKIKPQAEQGDKLARRLFEKWERQKQGISELEHFSREILESSTETKKQIMEGMGNLSHNPDEIRQPYELLQRVTQSLEHLQASLVEVTSGVEKMMAKAHRDARPSPEILRDIQELSGQIQAMKEIVSTYSNGERADQSHAGTVSPVRA